MATKFESATTNPSQQLATYGQSVWLDYIRRGIITNGELARLLREDGLRGVTSNPAIFEKAIAGSTDYTAALEELQKRGDLDAMAIYEHLAIRDIQDAADVLRPVYEQTRRRDGYVSLEVSPRSEEHTSELQSRPHLVCRLLLEKKKTNKHMYLFEKFTIVLAISKIG